MEISGSDRWSVEILSCQSQSIAGAVDGEEGKHRVWALSVQFVRVEGFRVPVHS